MTETSQTADNAFVSWREFLGRSDMGALALVCLAVWLHSADSLIIATMMPSIVHQIGGAALVGWSVSLYEIGAIVSGAASALLTLRYGLRAPMSCAALLFGLGCALSAISPAMPVLLIGRLLQGLGGGCLVSMAFVAITLLFPLHYATRAIAAVSTLWGVAAFAGPLIGGLFVEYADWRLGFWFFAAQALALAIWIALMKSDRLGPQSSTHSASFPISRLGLICLSVVLISLAGTRTEAWQTWALILAGIAALAAFIRFDGRAGDDRLLPRRPFDPTRSTGSALLIVVMFSIATTAFGTFGPLLLWLIHGTSALVAGYVIACSSISWTLMTVFFSGAPERWDGRMITIGMSAIAVSILGLYYAVPHGPIWLIAVFAAVEGGGFGLAWPFIVRRTTALADPDEVPRISGAIPTAQRLGYAIGAAVIGIVANSAGFATMADGAAARPVAQAIFLACLPFAAIGLLSLRGLVRNRPAT